MNEPRTDVLNYVRSRMVQAPTVVKRMITADQKVGWLRPRREFQELLEVANGFRKHGKEHMVLMSGIRGAGKSTLMAQLYKTLEDDGLSPSRMLFVSLDDSMLALGAGVMEVFSAFEQLVPQDLLSVDGRDVVVMLDEVQYDPEWSLALKVMYDRYPDVLVVVTGSSALQLREQGELARRGRFIDLPPPAAGRVPQTGGPSGSAAGSGDRGCTVRIEGCRGVPSQVVAVGSPRKGFRCAPGNPGAFPLGRVSAHRNRNDRCPGNGQDLHPAA